MEAREIEKCIDKFGTDVYRFCIKLCINKEDAEDLYQQTFLKALESNFNLNWEQNPKALFFSLSYNLFKSNIRKIARRNNIAPVVNINEENENLIFLNENFEEDIIQKELLNKINKIIEDLPDKIKIPLTLYYLFDFSTESISKIIKKPLGTVKSRLFKGRSLIKKRLEELGYDR